MVMFIMKNFLLPEPGLADEPVRLLMIGAGKMGEAHAAAFKRLNEVEIVGVVSRSGDSARRLAASYDIPHWGTDWIELANATQPHACVVAVSHLLNERITTEAIEYGLHTLAEKPVSLNGAVVQALAGKAQEKGIVAMAAMNRRFYPTITAALDIVRFYGPITGVTVIAPDPVRPYRARDKYDAEIYENWTRMNTLHAIDLLRLIGGEVEALCGAVQTSEAIGERSIATMLRFQNGALGAFSSYGSHPGQWETRIHGDGVEAYLLPLEQGVIRIGNARPVPLPASENSAGLKPGLPEQARAFIESIKYLGAVAPPGSDFFDHACTMQLVEKIVSLPEINLSNG
jgi:predicted dehydrogenase